VIEGNILLFLQVILFQMGVIPCPLYYLLIQSSVIRIPQLLLLLYRNVLIGLIFALLGQCRPGLNPPGCGASEASRPWPCGEALRESSQRGLSYPAPLLASGRRVMGDFYSSIRFLRDVDGFVASK
jgi:hypothetical protein